MWAMEDLQELEALCSTNTAALNCLSRLRRKLDVMSDIYAKNTRSTQSDMVSTAINSKLHAHGVAPLA